MNALVKSQLKANRGKPAKPGPVKKTPKGPKADEVAVPFAMTPSKEDLSYRAKEDARTLHEAHMIRNDKARMKAAADHVASLSEALSGPVKRRNSGR